MDVFTLLVQLVCGAAGGNLAAKVFPRQNLGPVGNSLAGLIGGGLGSSILSSLAGIGPPPTAGPDIGQLLAQAAGGGVGGAVLTMFVAMLTGFLQKPRTR